MTSSTIIKKVISSLVLLIKCRRWVNHQAVWLHPWKLLAVWCYLQTNLTFPFIQWEGLFTNGAPWQIQINVHDRKRLNKYGFYGSVSRKTHFSPKYDLKKPSSGTLYFWLMRPRLGCLVIMYSGMFGENKTPHYKPRHVWRWGGIKVKNGLEWPSQNPDLNLVGS